MQFLVHGKDGISSFGTFEFFRSKYLSLNLLNLALYLHIRGQCGTVSQVPWRCTSDFTIIYCIMF